MVMGMFVYWYFGGLAQTNLPKYQFTNMLTIFINFGNRLTHPIVLETKTQRLLNVCQTTPQQHSTDGQNVVDWQGTHRGIVGIASKLKKIWQESLDGVE